MTPRMCALCLLSAGIMPAIAYWDFVSARTVQDYPPASIRLLDDQLADIEVDVCIEDTDFDYGSKRQLQELIAGGAALGLSAENLALLIQHFQEDVRGSGCR